MYRIFILFLLSGAAGLIYQVVWSRMLHEVFGVTVYAVTTVLATFLAGLALGGWLLGRVTDRRSNPLRFYAVLEIGIALTGLLGLVTIRLLGPLHIWAANRFESDSVPLLAIRFLLGALVVLPPTFLMGGTLPAITRATVGRIQHLGRELSLLYALNTLGAVLGTLATGFVLIRWLGMLSTLAIAVSLNLLVGAAAFLLAREPRPGGEARTSRRKSESRKTTRDDVTGPPPAGLLWVMAISGFVSLGLEVLWTRVLMLSVGTTTYSFATMLASFLCGIALGSMIARRIVDRLADPRRTFGWIQLAIAASVLAGLPLINAGLTQRWLAGWGADWATLLLLRFGVSLLVMLVPTTLIGMTFPIAARLWARRIDTLGGQLGELYGANTLGNILGAAATGFVLLPWLGMQKGIAVLTVLNLACAAWALIPAPSGSSRRGARLRALPVAIGVTLGALLLFAWQPRPFPVWGESPEDRTLYYREGVAGTVKVIQRATDPGQIWMAVDSIRIGESRGGVDQKQQALAHFPFLLAPRRPPRSVLSIGLGTGILAGEVTRHAGVERVDCVEISPSVIEAARQFEPFNNGVLHNPTVRVIQDDGVNFLRRTDRRYDAIISDAKSRSKHAANGVFFSLDYYRLCREHLGEGGMMIQWVPLNVPPGELRTILRTFLEVFPHGYVWLAAPHSAFLVGTEEPLTLEADRIGRMLLDPALSNLRRYGIGDPVQFVAALAADRPSLEGWLSAEDSINSLNHPVLEFYSLEAYTVPPDDRAAQNVAGIIHDRGDQLNSVTFGPATASSVLAAQQALGALAMAMRMLDDPAPGNIDEAVRLLENAARRSPDHRLLRYGQLLVYRRALELAPRNTALLCALGRVLARLGRHEAALTRFRQALAVDPDNAAARAGIASILARHPQRSTE